MSKCYCPNCDCEIEDEGCEIPFLGDIYCADCIENVKEFQELSDEDKESILDGRLEM